MCAWTGRLLDSCLTCSTWELRAGIDLVGPQAETDRRGCTEAKMNLNIHRVRVCFCPASYLSSQSASTLVLGWCRPMGDGRTRHHLISFLFLLFSSLLSSLSSFLFFSFLLVYIHILPLLLHNNNHHHHLINMSHQHDDDDFGPSENSNYKVGQKKSLNEYQNLDADDEALRRWKESLGVASTGGKLIFIRKKNARTHRWLADLFV